MLDCITIKNIALIEELTLQIPVGFSVLTGETGAGKSIIIGALNFVLGERVSHDIIRSGATRCSVEAGFTVEAGHPVYAVLDELGIEAEQPGTLVLSRELTQAGRNVCRINGSMITAQDLKRVGDTLVDIHGQHEHQQLLDPKNHILFLDHFAGGAVLDALGRTANTAAEVKTARRLLRETRMDEMERLKRLELYEFQMHELDAADLQVGEEEQLQQRRQVLSNAQGISDSLSSVFTGFSDEGGILERMSSITKCMEGAGKYSGDMKNLAQQLGEEYYRLEELMEAVRTLKDTVTFDPQELYDTEDRLQLIADLKRKYGTSIEEIKAYRDRIGKEYETLSLAQENRQVLEERYKTAYYAYRQEAKALGLLRRDTAKRMKEQMELELHSLGMPHASFEVQFTEMERDVFDVSGIDIVEFLLCANGGEQLRPLSKVASGGELSRIMLAFKKLLSETDSVGTMVFDEIDTGISGAIGVVIGEKMAAISAKKQVICITHLPQIASMADHHYFVEKHEESGRTVSCIRLLEEEERPGEIARIMGSKATDAVALEHAAAMRGEGKEHSAKARQ